MYLAGVFFGDIFKMLVYRFLLLFTVFLFVLAGSGCERALLLQETPAGIAFPNEWVGNIDKDEFNEPSGICWHGERETLFVVGDEGDICEIGFDGTLVKQKHLRDADFEGVTHDPSSGLLYVAVEEAESIIEVHPETFEVLREFSIPRDFEGRTLLASGGEGIEAITFVPDADHPEGGVFYVANQAFVLSDEQDISAVFQVEIPLRSRTDEVRITGYFMPGIIDLSGLYYDSTKDTIFVISDAHNMIMEYSREYELLSVHAFPGDNQEGITVDADGYIYIAQDTGGIIKLKWLR